MARPLRIVAPGQLSPTGGMIGKSGRRSRGRSENAATGPCLLGRGGTTTDIRPCPKAGSAPQVRQSNNDRVEREYGDHVVVAEDT
jgi:hypothetical protein